MKLYFLLWYKKYCSSARITSLPTSVVDADTVDLFKARLGKFWLHQDGKYDFIADLTGFGNRSVHEMLT